MPVNEKGSLGILSYSDLNNFDKIAGQGKNATQDFDSMLRKLKELERKTDILPKAVTGKRKRDLQKGLAGGRFDDSTRKIKDNKFKADTEEGIFNRTSQFMAALGIKTPSQTRLKAGSLVSGVGPVAGISKVAPFKKLTNDVKNLKTRQKAIAGIVSEGNSLVSGASRVTTEFVMVIANFSFECFLSLKYVRFACVASMSIRNM